MTSTIKEAFATTTFQQALGHPLKCPANENEDQCIIFFFKAKSYLILLNSDCYLKKNKQTRAQETKLLESHVSCVFQSFPTWKSKVTRSR